MIAAHLLIASVLVLSLAGLLCEALRPLGPTAARAIRALRRATLSGRAGLQGGVAVPSRRATAAEWELSANARAARS